MFSVRREKLHRGRRLEFTLEGQICNHMVIVTSSFPPVSYILPVSRALSKLSVFCGSRDLKAPSTLIRFQTKTELFCSGYGYRPHYNAENDHRKRSHSKTLSRVERFENDAFGKRCFLVWTEKTMLSENGDVIK